MEGGHDLKSPFEKGSILNNGRRGVKDPVLFDTPRNAWL